MARPDKYEQQMTDLQCNACDEVFQGPAEFIGKTSDESGEVLGWIPNRVSYGVSCPNCGSELIGFQR